MGSEMCIRDRPLIRFYAGAPLKLPSGENIGTICLIDRTPRTLDKVDLAILASLRDLVVEELIQQNAIAD